MNVPIHRFRSRPRPRYRYRYIDTDVHVHSLHPKSNLSYIMIAVVCRRKLMPFITKVSFVSHLKAINFASEES